MQGLLDDFRSRFDDLQKMRSHYTFLVNLFIVDVINDSCLILKRLVMETSVEMELLEFHEDQGLKVMHKL